MVREVFDRQPFLIDDHRGLRRELPVDEGDDEEGHRPGEEGGPRHEAGVAHEGFPRPHRLDGAQHAKSEENGPRARPGRTVLPKFRHWSFVGAGDFFCRPGNKASACDTESFSMEVRKALFFAAADTWRARLASHEPLGPEAFEEAVRVVCQRCPADEEVYVAVLEHLLARAPTKGAVPWSAVESEGLLRVFHRHGWDLRADDDLLLRRAAARGARASYDFLKAVGADPLANVAEAFVLACQSGHLGIARDVASLAPWVPSCRGDSAFRMAADLGQLAAVQYLVDECGVDPALQSNLGLFLATAKRNVALALFLLDRGGRLEGKVEARDVEATWRAAGPAEQARLRPHLPPSLAVSTAPAPARKAEATALSKAVAEGRRLPPGPYEGADARAAFAMACQKGDLAAAKALAGAGDRAEGLGLAVAFGRTEVVRALRRPKESVNPEAVALAAANGHVGVLRHLHPGVPMPPVHCALSGGLAATVFLESVHGRTPEDTVAAARSGRPDLVRAVYTPEGRDRAHAVAAKHRFLEVADFLESKGAPPRPPAPAKGVRKADAPRLCRLGDPRLLRLRGWQTRECARAVGANGRTALAKALEDPGLRREAFLAAAENGRLACMDALFAGADQATLRRAFVNAAYHGRPHAVALLQRRAGGRLPAGRAKAWAWYMDRPRVLDLLG